MPKTKRPIFPRTTLKEQCRSCSTTGCIGMNLIQGSKESLKIVRWVAACRSEFYASTNIIFLCNTFNRRRLFFPTPPQAPLHIENTVDDAKIRGFECSFDYIVSNSIENSNTTRDSFLKVGNVSVQVSLSSMYTPQVFSGTCLGYSFIINFYGKVMMSLAAGTYKNVRNF